jgi:hypothetical protein
MTNRKSFRKLDLLSNCQDLPIPSPYASPSYGMAQATHSNEYSNKKIKLEHEHEDEERENLESPPKPLTEFMDLPGEIRNNIYRLALVTPGDQGILITTDPNDDDDDDDSGLTATPPALTQVNAQIRRESLPIFFGENTFRCTLFELWGDGETEDLPLVKWTEAIGSEGMGMVRNVRATSCSFRRGNPSGMSAQEAATEAVRILHEWTLVFTSSAATPDSEWPESFLSRIKPARCPFCGPFPCAALELRLMRLAWFDAIITQSYMVTLQQHGFL